MRRNKVVLGSAFGTRPNPNAEIIAAGGKSVAGGIKRALPHRARVPFQRVETAPIVAVAPPNFDSIIIRARCQQFLLRVPAHTLHVLRVAVQNPSALVVAVVRRLPNPNSFVARACCE